MEQPTDNDIAAVAAALAQAGIVLPPADIAFLASQAPMLARTIAAVREALA